MSGDLSIVVTADLGGLGSNEGPPVVYAYVPPSRIPLLAPWIFMGGLLLLRGNRARSVAWLLIPVLAIFFAVWLVQPAADLIGTTQFDAFTLMAKATGFALATALLLSALIGIRGRLRAAFLLLGIVELVSMAAFVLLSNSAHDVDLIPMLTFLAMNGLILTLALVLTGLLCRRKPSPARITLQALLWLLVGWTITVGVLSVIISAVGAIGPDLGEIIVVILSFGLGSFIVLLPFLVLSFLNPHHRQRLHRLLGADEADPTSREMDRNVR